MTDVVQVIQIDHGHYVERIITFSNGTKLTQGIYKTSLPPVVVDAVAVRPGNRAAAAAFRGGAEDEYIDAMRCRYGGEW